MDPFKLLKTDHKKVSQLFKKIESASSGATKAQLFTQLKSELDVHAHIEEKYLYPAIENKEKSREITLEAYEEHKVVKDLLAELATRSPDEQWDAKLTVLKENVEHHVEEEEGELFDKAEAVLSEDQIERLGAEMEAEKAAKTNGGPPRTDASRSHAAAQANGQGGSAKSETAESPGVLKRLANFVGLGEPAATARKTSAKKTATKKGATKKSPTAAKKAAKSGQKSAATTARGSKTAVKRKQTAVKKGGKAAASSSKKKTAKKSASKKK